MVQTKVTIKTTPMENGDSHGEQESFLEQERSSYERWSKSLDDCPAYASKENGIMDQGKN